nr:hypothetical protein [Streptomyces sp. SID4948]
MERTTKERERIAADLAALQEQLATLEQDHALLVGVHETLAGAIPAATPAAAQDTETAAVPAAVPAAVATAGPTDVPPAAVPRARKPTTARRAPKPATGSTKTATGAATKDAGNTATGGSSSAAAPTLVELVTADLADHSEPRSASEITTALTHAHPGRKMQTTVVRNTLEALVAKGQSLRSKQGRSVYYSATRTADTARTAAPAGKKPTTTA